MALKHQVTYKNIFGDEVTRDLYFNLTSAELAELDQEYADDGGFDGRLKRIGTAGTNGKMIIETLKNILGRSYGERQGDELVKGQDVLNRFYASEGYSQVLEGLASGKMNPYDFIGKILPEAAEKQINEDGKSISELARERSEEQMQGFQKKQAGELKSETVVLPETAPPVLEKAEPTQEELLALWKQQNNQS